MARPKGVISAESIRPGDVIMPPAREVSLWMRRHLRTYDLPESALHLTVTAVQEGAPDTRGRWLIVTAWQSPDWYLRPERVSGPHPFRFKARPETPWPLVTRPDSHLAAAAQ